MTKYLAWFDGACEPVNPGGTATFGVAVRDGNGTVLLKEHGLVGNGSGMSNNVAEYAGVLQVMKYLAPRPPGRVTIHGDSKLVINQLTGRWRNPQRTLPLNRPGSQRGACSPESARMADRPRGWIPRAQNEECDTLSKKTGDPPYKPTEMNRQFPQVPSGNRRSQRGAVCASQPSLRQIVRSDFS